MARIAFFSERLPTESQNSSASTGASYAAQPRDPITAFSYGLITSLADQQHDVRVYSTYRENEQPPPSLPRLQVLRPFRNWGWLEIPRLIPILLDFQPELIHIIQPRAEALGGFTNALTALPGISTVMGRPRFVISLYDVRKEELQKNKSLLSFCDVVIVTNRQQADEVAKWYGTLGARQKMPLIEIVPLPSSENDSGVGFTSSFSKDRDSDYDYGDEIEVMPALDMIAERCANLVLIPGDLGEQREPMKLVAMLNDIMAEIPDLGIVFGGGWGRLSIHERRALMREFEDRGHGARVLLTGPLSPAQEAACLAASKIVFLAALNDSSLSLARWIRQSLKAARPLVLRDEQCRLDPLKWQDRINAFIVGGESSGWGKALAESILNRELRSNIQQSLPDFTRTEAVDQPGNAMSRIYAQVLRTPRNPLR